MIKLENTRFMKESVCIGTLHQSGFKPLFNPVYARVYSRKTLSEILKLLPQPVVATTPAPAGLNRTSLINKAVCVTGTIPNMDRNAVKNWLLDRQMQPFDTCTHRVSLLVIGSRPGEKKLERARMFNVPTMTWAQFKILFETTT
jgi:NAD-dependent DNA ligase